MSAPLLTLLRRILAAGLLAAFVAPVLVPAAVGGPSAGGRARMAPGAACCAAMACCAAAAPCATGHCDRAAHPGSPSTGAMASAATETPSGPKLAAGCQGPAPATTVADRDPMVSAPGTDVPPASTPRLESLRLAGVPSLRCDAPSVPPPRV